MDTENNNKQKKQPEERRSPEKGQRAAKEPRRAEREPRRSEREGNLPDRESHREDKAPRTEARQGEKEPKPKRSSNRRRQKARRQADGETLPPAGGELSASGKPRSRPQKQSEPSPAEAEEAVEETPGVSYEVIGVRFKQNGKVYYFDPVGMAFGRGAHVIVDTARGIEYGFVTMANRVVSSKDIVLPLRKVIRAATEEDEKRHEANLEKEVEAYNLCLSRIEAHRLEMKLVDVEYTFDNTKLLFYFTAEGRVDFRELVKDLASAFRTRIELRQIGIRDEAKLMGGLGVCGRPFCCASFLSDFVQVSIKMAKEQSLSLNSSKISGACGRLMCCLRYEYETYTEEIAKTPKVDTIVATPDGDGVVVEVSPLAGLCKVSLSKNPATVQLYHRDDLKIKGYAKGKRKGGEPAPSETEELKKLEEN